MKKILTTENCNEFVSPVIDQIFGLQYLDNLRFKNGILSVELSRKAYGDDWGFGAHYIKKTKSKQVSSRRYEKEFSEFVTSLNRRFDGIEEVRFEYCGV